MKAFALLLFLAGAFLLVAAWCYHVQGVSILGVLAMVACVRLFSLSTNK